MCPPLAGHLDYLRPQGLPVPHQPTGMKFTNIGGNKRKIIHRFFQSTHGICTVGAKKTDISVSFCLIQTEVKQLFHAQQMETEWDGVYVAIDKRNNLQSTISVVASMKKMPEESKKAKRFITLSKRLQLEGIIADWQCEVSRSSIAVVHCPRRLEKTVAVLNYRL